MKGLLSSFTPTLVYIDRFNTGKAFNASKNTQNPADIANNKVTTETGVIDCAAIFFLLRVSMKRAEKNIKFKNATVSVFGETIDLVVTKCGYHVVPLTALCQIIHIQNSSKVNVTLSLHSNDDKKQMARKLWCQFAHAPSDKLLKLVPSAGQPWSTDSEL